MANHPSALKRMRQSRKRRLYNRSKKKLVKEAIKSVLNASTYEEASNNFRLASSVLDRIAAKGVLHKNTVAHRKSRLSKHCKSLKTATA